MLYRVYFNRAEELPWSVDEGSHETEINIQAVRIVAGKTLMTGTDIAAEWPNPKAWINVEGSLKVEHGIAIIA